MPARLLLLSAIVFEVLGIIMMKLSDGFQIWWASLLMLLFFGISFLSFSFCIRKMEVSITYAIWTASGSVLIVLAGMFLFKETITIPMLLCLGLIVLGILVLGN